MLKAEQWAGYIELAEYWDLVPAIVGGVIGALAGGIPAWLLAKRQSDETLLRDREQRTETQKALAFAVSVKLLHITNSTLSLTNHVKKCLSLLENAQYKHMEPWQILVPMIGHTEDEGSIRFSAEEMAVFAAFDEYDFMQDLMLLALRQSSTLSSFKTYCEMRSGFQAIGPKPHGFDGQIGLGTITVEEALSYKPYTIPMNNIVIALDAGLDTDISLARSVSERFGPITKRMFNVEKFASLKFPTDVELAEMRKPLDPTLLPH